jgi:hypothetical protein
MDKAIQQDITLSRSADALDADLKRRLCLALHVTDAAMVHEAVLVYSPTAQALLAALTLAIATHSGDEPAADWRFVSDQADTLATLTKRGAIALHPRGVETAAFQYLGNKREAIFGP